MLLIRLLASPFWALYLTVLALIALVWLMLIGTLNWIVTGERSVGYINAWWPELK
jgi:hypothetical protein